MCPGSTANEWQRGGSGPLAGCSRPQALVEPINTMDLKLRSGVSWGLNAGPGKESEGRSGTGVL